MMVRVNPWRPAVQLRHEMDRLMHELFRSQETPNKRILAGPGFPALNVWEEGDALVAEAEVPGVKSDDLEISVVGADLTIRGRRESESGEQTTYYHRERGTGEFNRVIRLPVEIDADKVEATLVDGVLALKLPKAESAKPKKIKVEVAK
jgi:HSP20 family protein